MVFVNKRGSQVEITGVATLCFNEEGTGFQGSIVTDDDTQYAIYGTKSKKLQEEGHLSAECCECTPLEDGSGISVTFDIRVVDCEVGEEYTLKRVHGTNGESCTFSCSSITFCTENVYRGHRADLISKNCLGHKMEGKRTSVYTGPIQLTCGVNAREIQWVL
ncbi:hypothetical protein SK128_012501 [Halocaridina rubra]|uniref:Uncharacterized protein n=1 Tax=Halocaridina rubra TaxID=373956 RepID=A0AAN8WJ06_HALRR